VTDAEFRERTATELRGWFLVPASLTCNCAWWLDKDGKSVRTHSGPVSGHWDPANDECDMHQALEGWCRLQDGRWVDHTYGPVFKHVPVGGRDDDRVALGQHAVVVVQCYGNTFLAAARAALEQAMGGKL